jgi:hypothetical protein
MLPPPAMNSSGRFGVPDFSVDKSILLPTSLTRLGARQVERVPAVGVGGITVSFAELVV